MLAGVELSPEALARLASALNAERRRVAAVGGRWPVELDLLTTIAVRAVRGGRVAVRDGQPPVAPGAGREDELVNLRGAAIALGVSERTLRRLRADGSLPTVAVAGRRFVRRSAIVAFIDQRAGA
ncbi:MAG: helix-turn-helix domain-containing protein [Acidimicrobiales bacterium]